MERVRKTGLRAGALRKLIGVSIFALLSSAAYAQSPRIQLPSPLTIVHVPLTDTHDCENGRLVKIVTEAPIAVVSFRVNGGRYSELPTVVDGKYWIATIPPYPVDSVVEYYIQTSDPSGTISRSPFGAPSNLYKYGTLKQSKMRQRTALVGEFIVKKSWIALVAITAFVLNKHFTPFF